MVLVGGVIVGIIDNLKIAEGCICRAEVRKRHTIHTLIKGESDRKWGAAIVTGCRGSRRCERRSVVDRVHLIQDWRHSGLDSGAIQISDRGAACQRQAQSAIGVGNIEASGYLIGGAADCFHRQQGG